LDQDISDVIVFHPAKFQILYHGKLVQNRATLMMHRYSIALSLLKYSMYKMFPKCVDNSNIQIFGVDVCSPKKRNRKLFNPDHFFQTPTVDQRTPLRYFHVAVSPSCNIVQER